MPPRAELNVRGVLEHALHVVEATDAVEVVLLVVIEGRLFPHPSKDGIGVELQVGVVRVVVDLVVSRHCHPT